MKRIKGMISACVIVYNEEKIIRRCLDSIKGVVDEIVVVHDGPCKDSTLEIAKECGARVYVRPREGEASPHYTFAHHYAKGEWILRIDADEYLSSELKAAIPGLIKNPDVNAYRFKWDGYCRAGKHIYEYKVCLFRKNARLPFYGVTHELLHFKGLTKNLDLELVHRPAYDYYSWQCYKSKIPKTKTQARYIVRAGWAQKPLFFYFVKAPLWAVLYLGYSIVHYRDFRVALYNSVYNFFVWWNVFVWKLHGEKYEPSIEKIARL